MTGLDKPLGRVLAIAGSDSGAGAGIQADIKTVLALGGFATTAITALTAQNTKGVFGTIGVKPTFVADQINVVMRDIGADCWKTGMLHDGSVIEAVVIAYENFGSSLPLIVDPVMLAKGGHRLLEPSAIEILKKRLIPLATLITPNIPEAELLSGEKIHSYEDVQRVAELILSLGCRSVLLKGGHLHGPIVKDLLCTADGVETYENPRIQTKHTHGTGCTLASAIAASIAQGIPLRDAVLRARAYLREGLLTAPSLGHGNGPLNHAHSVKPFNFQS